MDLFMDLVPPPLPLQQGLNYIMSAYSSAVTYSLHRFEVCLLSAKLHVIWPSSLKQQVSKACIIRKERFVAQQVVMMTLRFVVRK